MLALKISGRLLKVETSELEPLMVIGEQRMYISLLPILLNQVQARTAFPDGASEGMVYGRVYGP
jgi:hypothetical protein